MKQLIDPAWQGKRAAQVRLSERISAACLLGVIALVIGLMLWQP